MQLTLWKSRVNGAGPTVAAVGNAATGIICCMVPCAIWLVLFTALAVGTAHGGRILLPSDALERNATVRAIYRADRRATGNGKLSIEWRDAYARLVEKRTVAVELHGQTDIAFDLDLRRAAAMQNELRARLSLGGRSEEAQLAFIARPPADSWWDYQIVMWQERSPETLATLKTLGITAGVYSGRSRTPPEYLLRNDLRWYAENIATDFYSAYHRYYPDHRDNGWAFLQTKELYRQDPSSRKAFERRPSLSDPTWLAKVRERLIETARFFSPYRPLFYSLGDETGVAELAAFWDFDFSDESLVAMRAWLKQRYGDLDSLNRQWGTDFQSWSWVMPATTNQAMRSRDDNFSSWADFKEWMDICFANALKAGADAVRSVDPEAYVGIGGAQMPGWGGYDYSRITRVLTAIEAYDIGNNIEIIHSLNPDMAVMTTSFARGPWEKHRVWHELLHGNRGLILWDDKGEYAAPTPGPRGRETSSYYQEIRDGLGALLISSRRQADPIAIHYSQPSMRTEWMLEQRSKGGAWVKRSSASEYQDSSFLRLRESYCRLIEDAGRQYSFVSYDQLAGGELARGEYRVVILPHSSAMSLTEARAVHEFVWNGGVLIADGDPGAFDEHGRRLPRPQFADLFPGPSRAGFTERTYGRGKAIHLDEGVIDYERNRASRMAGATRDLVAGIFHSAGVDPAFAVFDQSGRTPTGVETHIFRNGAVTIVGLLTNPEQRIGDLGQPDFPSGDVRSRSLRLRLPANLYGYDIRRGTAFGRKRELEVELDPYEPALFAFSVAPLPELRMSAPTRLHRGQTGLIRCSFSGPTAARTHVLHIEIATASGNPVACYSGNVLAPLGRAVWRLPLAWNDPPGKWSVRVRDVLSGQVRVAAVEVL
jgi:Beta-galactosidase